MTSKVTLSVIELARQCAEEMARYRNQRVHEAGHCYELLRLALVERDDKAWAAVYEQYHRLVRIWIGCAREDADVLVNQAFERFWRAVPPERFNDFPTLSRLLAYLKRCAQSTAIDAQRKRERIQAHEAALSALHQVTNSTVEDAPADYLLDEIVAEQVFEHALKRLSGQQERIVFRASIEWGLKPAAIAERWSEHFCDALEVSRVKERIFRRLQRDTDLKAMMGIDDDDGEEI